MSGSFSLIKDGYSKVTNFTNSNQLLNYNVEIPTSHRLAGALGILGLFNSIMKEFVEILYQYDRDYVFDSSKFEKAYDFKPTSNLEGMKAVVKAG